MFFVLLNGSKVTDLLQHRFLVLLSWLLLLSVRELPSFYQFANNILVRFSPMESPRLWFFENRLKLLSIVTVVYSFLLYLLSPDFKDLIETILRLKCHRTGKRCREAVVPLYRVHWAICRLWNDHRPALGSVFPPNWETLHVLAAKRC